MVNMQPRWAIRKGNKVDNQRGQPRWATNMGNQENKDGQSWRTCNQGGQLGRAIRWITSTGNQGWQSVWVHTHRRTCIHQHTQAYTYIFAYARTGLHIHTHTSEEISYRTYIIFSLCADEIFGHVGG